MYCESIISCKSFMLTYTLDNLIVYPKAHANWEKISELLIYLRTNMRLLNPIETSL